MTNAQPEPSMEEILASIRRIISEDEEEQPGVDRAPLEALASAQDAVRESVAETVGAEVETRVAADENALTRMLDIAEGRRAANPEVQAVETESVNEVAESESKPESEIVSDLTSEPVNESICETEDEIQEDQAARKLETEDVKMVKQAVAVQEADSTIIDNQTASAAAAAFGNLSRSVRVADDEGQTLEAVVTEMLRPMVKDWLDANLARIVEQKVEDEVQRVSRRS